MGVPLERLGDLLTRIDDLLVLLLRVEEEQLELLRLTSERIAPVAAPPIPPAVREKIIERYEVALRTESIMELAKELAKRILQLPNRLDRIEWNTKTDTWTGLRGAGLIKPAIALGFWVEDIGGGFEYRLVRAKIESDEKTAEVDDKWDQEFDDLLVKGTGVAGTAKIWIWWRVD